MTSNTDLSKKYDMLPDGARVLCAVSGGADSVYMLHRLLELSRTGRIALGCAHFDHALRGEASKRDAAFVRALASELDLPFFTAEGDVAAFSRENRMGIEEAARRLRYDFLYAAARENGFDRIATAHTADDNAETVLLNLCRGSGLRGLCGIPPRRGALIRPILCTSRAELEDWLVRRGIAWVEDETNGEDGYARNRIRRHVSPVLRGINPRFADNALQAGELMRADEEFLQSLADDFIREYVPELCKYPAEKAEAEAALPITELLALPTPVSARVIKSLCGDGCSGTHVASVLKLCRSDRPSALLCLPGLRVGRRYGELVLSPPEPSDFREIALSPGQCVPIPELSLTVSCRADENACEINDSFNILFFKTEAIRGKISVRPRAGGDKIRILGRGVTKTLKKLFSEARVPPAERDRIPVIADDSGVLAVRGFGVDERAAAKPGEPATKICFERIF